MKFQDLQSLFCSVSRRTQGRSPVHPCAIFCDQLHGPIRFPQHLCSVHDHGRQRSDRGPDCTLSRLRAEEYDWPMTQSIATPETSSRTIHPGPPLEPGVCQHTREPTVLSRVSCRPFHLNIDRLHQPCQLPWRTSRIGGACRFPRTKWRPLTLAGSPALPPSRLPGGIATPTRRYHGRMLIHPSLPACATPDHKVFAHTQARDPSSPPPPVVDTPWGPHLPGPPLFVL